MEDHEVIKALECCQTQYNRNCEKCPYEKYRSHAIRTTTCESEMRKDLLTLITKQKSEVESLRAFRQYFDSLYGTGLEIAKWHENGALEPFDNFYDAAIEEGDANYIEALKTTNPKEYERHYLGKWGEGENHGKM